MAVVRQTQIQHYTGLSSDTKPTAADVLTGARFVETDTGAEFIYDGSAWQAMRFVIQGTVADGAAAAGNIVRTGGVYDSAPGAHATGDSADFLLDSRGRLLVVLGQHNNGDETVEPEIKAYNGDGEANSKQGLITISRLQISGPDAASDRVKGAGDTAGSGLGAVLTSPTGHAHNSVTGDEQIMAAAGKLHTITVHDITTGGTITVYDNTAESGTVIATLTLAAGEGFTTFHYDVNCATGLYIGYDASVVGDLTVSYAI